MSTTLFKHKKEHLEHLDMNRMQHIINHKQPLNPPRRVLQLFVVHIACFEILRQ